MQFAQQRLSSHDSIGTPNIVPNTVTHTATPLLRSRSAKRNQGILEQACAAKERVKGKRDQKHP